MEATPAQLDALRKLQDLDRTRIQSELALSKLPQPAQAAQVHKKLEEVAVKLSQIRKLHDDALARIDSLSNEDDQLVEKMSALQERINETQGDYRSVSNLTRDLEGAAKRRETVQFEMGKAEARKKEVEQVLSQAETARNVLAKQEADLAESYRQEGGKLKAIVEQSLEGRTSLLESLPEELVSEYERVLKRCGGVALATVEEGTCSACRSIIDPDRALHMQKEAPLSHCPHCGRLAIIA